jgi:flagellar biosynthesis GTPase FlhF
MNWFNLLHPVWYMEADKGDGTDVKVTDGSEKKETAIDWTKIDASTIPEDLIKKNPAYKTVLDESVKRRQEIKKLKDDALKLGSDEEEKPVKKEETKEKEEEAPSWAKQIIEEINALKSGSLESWKQEAADEFGIKSKSVIKTLGRKDERMKSLLPLKLLPKN